MNFKGSKLFIVITIFIEFVVYLSLVSIGLLCTTGSIVALFSSSIITNTIVFTAIMAFSSIIRNTESITIINRKIDITTVTNNFVSINVCSDYKILQKKRLWTKTYIILNGKKQKVLKINNYEITKGQRKDFDYEIEKLKSI